jgi:hypothetical protein
VNRIRGPWLLPIGLISIHFVLQTWLFVGAQTSDDPEIFSPTGIAQASIAFPASRAVIEINKVVWEKKILWDSERLYVRNWRTDVDRFFGFTKQTVDDFMDFVLFVVAGSLQWGIVGFLLQLGWRRIRRQERT